jgi:hypothetical protein
MDVSQQQVRMQVAIEIAIVSSERFVFAIEL